MLNSEKVIKGLEWILKDDRFGFGVNWDTDCEPKTEEEQAGYNIQRAINLLKDWKGLMLALEQSNAANEYLNVEVERLNGLLKEQKAEIEHLKRPDCEHAEHDGVGCLGYCGCTQDDEPIESCKRCEKYTGNVYEAVKWDG